MDRGKLALLIPSQLSDRGLDKLVQELKAQEVTVLGKDKNIALVKWDDPARLAVAKGLSIKEFYADRISPAVIKELPEDVARVALLWNWSIDRQGRKVTTGAVKQLMGKLQLEVKNGQVFDVLTRKVLGNVESKEEEDSKSNWCLNQGRGWERIPGWFGYWEKLWCRSRTYVSSSCSGSRLVVDYILAEVDGPRHYAYQSRYNASIAYAEAWSYIWVGQSHCGTAFSYARQGSATVSITRRIC